MAEGDLTAEAPEVAALVVAATAAVDPEVEVAPAEAAVSLTARLKTSAICA